MGLHDLQAQGVVVRYDPDDGVLMLRSPKAFAALPLRNLAKSVTTPEQFCDLIDGRLRAWFMYDQMEKP